MNPFIIFLIGFVFGYLLRGWFRKSNQDSYATYDLEYTLGDKPEYFGRPIKITNPDFEQVWLGEHVMRDYGSTDSLNDNDYIAYHIWDKEHSQEMYNKHIPEATVIRGNPSNVVFHGGCLGCVSQERYGINRCKGCQYFRANWGLPDLSIK